MGLSRQDSHCLTSHLKAAALNMGQAQIRTAEEGGDTGAGPGGGDPGVGPGGGRPRGGAEGEDTEVSLREGDTGRGLGRGDLGLGSPESSLCSPPSCNKGTDRETTQQGHIGAWGQ